MKRITLAILGIAAALALVAVGIGTAGAVTVEDWNGSEPVNESYSVGNSTESLRVIADTIENDTATVTVYGVENGTETQVNQSTISTNSGATGESMTTWDYSLSEPPEFDEYKVSVAGDGAETLEVAKVELVSGGGGAGLLPGGLSLDGVPTIELIAGGLVLAVVGGGAAYTRW